MPGGPLPLQYGFACSAGAEAMTYFEAETGILRQRRRVRTSAFPGPRAQTRERFRSGYGAQYVGAP